MLKDILTVSGKSGLFRLVSRGSNMLIVESLVTKERIPVYSNERVSSLQDISIFCIGEDVPLADVFTKIKEREGGKPVSIDIKNADKASLQAYFGQVVNNFDRDRVYVNDIQKALKWYNILVENGITDFKTKESEDESVGVGENLIKNNAVAPKTAQNSEKAQQKRTTKSAVAPVKTGVGAKKG